MPSRIAKTKRPRTAVTQRKNGHTVKAAKFKTPVGFPSNLARVLRPQAAFRWRGPNLSQYTPTYIEGILSGAMAGSHSQQWELFKMMFDTWPELSSCKQELTYGLMKKNLIFEAWHDEDEKPSDLAIEKSKVVSAALRQMMPQADRDENALEGTISDILNGWFTGVIMLEILWNVIDSGPNGMIAAPRATFIVDPMYYAFSADGTIGLRSLDKNGAPYPSSNPTFNPSSQAATRLTKLPPDKFLIGIHKATAGSALAGSLLRPLAWWWCAANFASDWMLNLAQVFGLPFRWATFEQNATPETKDALANMLQNMGSSGWAMFPAGTEMELKTPPGGNSSDHSPQGELLDRADRYCRALILGQTMSGGSGTTGKGGGQAFGTVEEGVKDDRIDAAGRYVAGVLNQQMVKSILMLNYGEASEAPEARFLEDAEAELPEAQRDQTLVSMGVPIGVDYFRKKYDVPEPADDEEIVSGISTGQKEAEEAKTELLKQGMDQKAEQMKQGAKPGEKKPKPDDAPAKAKQDKNSASSFPIADAGAYLEAINALNKMLGTSGKTKRDFPVKSVPRSSIRAIQLGVDEETVAKYVNTPPDTYPVAIAHNGLHFMVDGHHRAEAQVRKGADSIKMHVVPVDSGGRWVTINGRHVFIEKGDKRSAEEILKSSELRAGKVDVDDIRRKATAAWQKEFPGDSVNDAAAWWVDRHGNTIPVMYEHNEILQYVPASARKSLESDGVGGGFNLGLARVATTDRLDGPNSPDIHVDNQGQPLTQAQKRAIDDLAEHRGGEVLLDRHKENQFNQGDAGRWVTINGRHVFIANDDTRPIDEIIQSQPAKASEAKGRWVTINGRHVFIAEGDTRSAEEILKTAPPKEKDALGFLSKENEDMRLPTTRIEGELAKIFPHTHVSAWGDRGVQILAGDTLAPHGKFPLTIPGGTEHSGVAIGIFRDSDTGKPYAKIMEMNAASRKGGLGTKMLKAISKGKLPIYHSADFSQGFWEHMHNAHPKLFNRPDLLPPVSGKDAGTDLDFYLGDLREDFIRAFKGDLTPLRGALEIALANNTEADQREALIALQPKLPELLKTFIDKGVSPEILAKAIATAFTDGWHSQKTE